MDVRVWVGCIACYNDGELVGQWLDAHEAVDWSCPNHADHEEFWCYDQEIPGVDGEISPQEAYEWAERFDLIPDDMADMMTVVCRELNMPNGPQDFDPRSILDNYVGHYDSPIDHAWELNDEWAGRYGDKHPEFMRVHYSLDEPAYYGTFDWYKDPTGGGWVFTQL
jgi:hypothetical protein